VHSVQGSRSIATVVNHRRPDHDASGDHPQQSRGIHEAMVDMGRMSVHDKCMAVKTITIDIEAYGLLARHKREGESFSQVIKAHFGPQPTAGRFLAHLKTSRISGPAIDAMERQVRARKTNPARAVQR